MALNLSTTGIADGQVITAAQITQSIDALTGAAAYNITISGSFTLSGGTTGSGTYNRSLQASSVEIANLGVDNYYTIPHLSSTGSSTALVRYSGTNPSFNPVTETLKVTNLLGTASFCASSSLAQTASYINPSALSPTKYTPTYTAIDATNNTASINPYRINGANASMIYISASQGDMLGIEFWSTGITDGQIVTFNPHYQSTNGLDPTKITLSGSNVDIYGLNNQSISGTPPGNSGLLSSILPAGITTLYGFSFQYVQSTVPPYMQPGWYLVNLMKA